MIMRSGLLWIGHAITVLILVSTYSRATILPDNPSYDHVDLTDADSVNSRLTIDLLRRHSTKARPVENPDEQLKVSVLCALYQIVDVDQRSNLATISAYFDLWWRDQYLRWNVSDYNGATETYLPSEMVWTPDLYLYHSVQGSTPLAVQQSAVHITYDGTVRVFIPFTARALCTINVKYFPFDSQECEFVFGSWSYRMESVQYIVANEDVFLNDFYDNQEWILVNCTLQQTVSLYTNSAFNETYSTVTLSVVLQRQSFYYVFNLVLPVTLVTLVSVIGFHVPADSSERRESKFRLGIMTLLSMGVLLLNVVTDMPKFSMTSEPGKRGSFSDVPLLGLFYIALIVIISVGTMNTGVFVALEKYALHHPSHVPGFLRWLDFDWPNWSIVWREKEYNEDKWSYLSKKQDRCIVKENDHGMTTMDVRFSVKDLHLPLARMDPEENEYDDGTRTDHSTTNCTSNNEDSKRKSEPEVPSPTRNASDRTSSTSQSYRCAPSTLRHPLLPNNVDSLHSSNVNHQFAGKETLEIICRGILCEIRTIREVFEKRDAHTQVPDPHRQQSLLTKPWSRVIHRLEMLSLTGYLGLVCTALCMFFFYCWY